MNPSDRPAEPKAEPSAADGTTLDGARSISISLVSHTNVGKTTLARTLLGRDIGEVRDAPHVTETADVHTMLQLPGGEALQLWDTPGFGDSLRLAKRLKQSANPLGWFMSAVWDRWRDRPFWASQQALRNVREQADIVLYLVNAAEEPAAAGYVAPEMELLQWMGKPVIVLVNQLGPPRAAALEQAEVDRWREHLAAQSQVASVLPFDAFARCWVQEFTLFGAIEAALPETQRPLMQRLHAAWRVQRLATFDASIAALAQSLARIATARQVLAQSPGLRGFGSRLREVGASFGIGRSQQQTPGVQAQQALATALDAEVHANTAQLIALHGLAGHAEPEILDRLATHFQQRTKLGEGDAAVVGGMLTGALAGLKADIATGGLSHGGGLIAGGLLGALGGAGLARCVNLVRGTDQSWVRWNVQALDEMVEAALLRYLAVAHFGRGRGQWAQAESPSHWKEAVARAVAPYSEAFDALWSSRGARAPNGAEAARLAAELRPLLREISAAILRELYPDSLALGDLFSGGITAERRRPG